ncbi:DUF7262 family protein [Halocatena pleomorpha]|uniref:Uncharacterized protein n=1 Tax=Halocatena pleomorpha TaxID=1785090 RepID=A0A3P3R6U1_9EURY|nr:hypothetical protein [Halocatena pleomorpha]RRJ29181.1 hypothetical protein EIK79_13675 [Halocatena pleomorpha]
MSDPKRRGDRLWRWLLSDGWNRVERAIPNTSRAQLSLPVMEVAIGVLVVFAVLSGIILGIPPPEPRETQLDTYARDTATLLEDPSTPYRLPALTTSRSGFEQGAPLLSDRLKELLPENLMARIETPHGVIGYRSPSDAPIGQTTIPTPNGSVRILVWYP